MGDAKSQWGDVNSRWGTRLPYNLSTACRHIFSVRLHSGQGLIERELFANRWQKTFQSIEEDTTASPSPKNIVIMTPTKKQKILSTPQKYTCFSNIAKNMASLNSQIGTKQFNARLEQMEDLYNLWLEQKDICDRKTLR